MKENIHQNICHSFDDLPPQLGWIIVPVLVCFPIGKQTTRRADKLLCKYPPLTYLSSFPRTLVDSM